MVKIFFYDLVIQFLDASHLKHQTFYEKVKTDSEADFLFISLTNYEPFFERLKTESSFVNKKIVLYNLTEPISFGAAKSFLEKCIRFGINSKNVLFHSTNHFLDKFNCLHKGLSITDHSIKSGLYTGFVPYNERFLKYSFINNSIRTPRALVLNELFGRKINFNQSYVSCNGDLCYGDRNIQKYPNITHNRKYFQSHDYDLCYDKTVLENDLTFQHVYKNSFFNFTIETFSEFGMDNGGFNSHLTEKTIRNFAHKIPFLLLISSEEQIKIIENLGFVLFNDIFDFKIDLNNKESTVKKYVDIIEKFSEMKSIEVKRLIYTKEFWDRIEHNFYQYLYYKNLDIENIYKHILSNKYENKNELLLNTNEEDMDGLVSIISSQI